MTTATSGEISTQAPPTPDPRRWRVLILLCGLQFMILLDLTVVNVALPQIQDGLGFSASGLAWVVNAYVLAAGGLLILGGRLADVFGRRRLLLIGVVLFAAASAVSGAATSQGMMIAGRFGQGAAEAIAAPASLGLIALMFTDPKERIKALGIWGGIIGVGATLGYIIGGVVADSASWRWIFFINLPVALLVLVLIPRLVSESRMVRDRKANLDVAGAATLTLGMTGLVYGLLQAAEHPWGSATVILPLVAGAALLVTMVVIELRSRDPLIPMSFFVNRTRSAVNGVTILFMAAFISYNFMMSLFQQQVLGWSPLESGLSWMPMAVAIGAGIGLGTWLVPRLGVRFVCVMGYLGAGAGLLMTSTIDVGSSYLGGIMPGMIVFGLFAGASMPSCTNASLHEVTVQDSSLASGVLSTMQQIGAALGVAVLVTLAIRDAGDAVARGVAGAVAQTEGYATSLLVGGGLLVLGGLLLLALMERVDTELRDPIAESYAEASQPPAQMETPRA